MMKNKYNYLITCLLLTVISCSVQNSTPTPTSTIDPNKELGKASLGPTGGGTIDPKITSGQTVINYKKGFNTLVLNIKLTSDSAFKTKDTTTATPITTSSNTENKSENSVEKVTTELEVNGQNLKFDISKDKFTDNQHKINVTGLTEGDTINLESRVYDKNGKIVGSENVKNKKIDKEFEAVDLNISVSINISNTNTQNVNVSQTQTVTGPNITINLPAPPSNQNPPQPPAPPMPTQIPVPVQTPIPLPTATILNTTSTTQVVNKVDNNCVRPSIPDHKLVLSDGSTIVVCPKPELRASLNITSCVQPTADFKLNLPNGQVITLCPPN